MESNLPDFALILPELIVAIGAMALLMFGVYAGERSAPTVNGLAVVVLSVSAIRAADWPHWQGPERTRISIETGLL